jgi:hypothetical protein
MKKISYCYHHDAPRFSIGQKKIGFFSLQFDPDRVKLEYEKYKINGVERERKTKHKMVNEIDSVYSYQREMCVFSQSKY